MGLRSDYEQLLKGKIQELFEIYNIEGFKIEFDDYSILFRIEEEHRICRIHLSFFIDKFRPKEVNFSNATYGSGISFKNVNLILGNIMTENQTFGNTLSRYPAFNNTLDIFFFSNVPIIADESFQEGNFNSLMKLIIENIKTYHLPFFDRVSSLQVVNDEIIDKVPQMELGNYIPSQYMNLKKLIIMKLCNNLKYDEFKKWLHEV